MEDQLEFLPKIPRQYKISKVIKRNGQVVQFDPEKITNAIFKAAVEAQGSNRQLSVQLTEKAIRMLQQTCPSHSLPTVEEIQDIIEKALIENGHARTAKAFILYRAERARLREKKESALVVEDNVPYKLVWKSYVWNVDHGCDTVENLNRLVRSGDWKKLVMDSERHYNSEIRKVSQDLLKRKGEVRLMLIAGPSSSGKTTTTLKIGERLKEEGISFVILNCDNYFKSLEHHPKDEYGDYDFEGPEALDLPLINEHLQTLMKGKPVRMPIYDFKTGLHRYSDTLLHLEKNEILLIDSLHGLYPPLSESVAPEQKFRFYIEAICQIKDLSGNFVRWTDLRMLRRMIRDSHQRGCEPSRTVGHWHYVRRSEKRHIVPYIHTADSVFNGSLPYELPVHKTFLEKSLPEIIKKYDRDPKKMDASIRTHRVQKLLRSLSPFPDVRFIPKDSFLREFIGGSAYQY